MACGTASTAAYRCKRCDQTKPRTDFYEGALKRSFYFCRTCCVLRSTEYRRQDHAARLAARLRMRMKRAGVPMNLGTAEIRELLNGVGEDVRTRVTLERLPDSADPLSLANVVVVQPSH